jgi:hypothetical protein
VLASEPVLPEMPALLARANATRDVWRFIVAVRAAFAAAVTAAAAS